MHHQPQSTVPFQSLTEEEVMAQMKQGPSLRQLRKVALVAAVVVLVICLIVFAAALTLHAFILLAKFGWEALL